MKPRAAAAQPLLAGKASAAAEGFGASRMRVHKSRRRTGGPAICLAMALLGALCGCTSAIEFGRSVSGVNKNDPDPATAPFTGNLDKAEASGYGNLASVPPPPTLATTVAERQKLAEHLAAERTSAEAKDARGEPGSATAGPVPPPPPVPESIAAPQLAEAPPRPKPETAVPARKMDEPPEPQPQDSSLQTPQLGNPPGVEPPRAGPAQGRMPAAPAPAPTTLTAATVQANRPQPAPAQATLPAPQPSPAAAAMPPPKLPPTPTVVAALDLAPNSTTLAADGEARLAQVVAQYQAKPRPVRVVAYAAPGVGSAEQLNAFRFALDRAQDIAKRLGAAGIPANQIQTEASPASPAAPPGRIEVQLLDAAGG
jgi:hypothetical protein